jgi:hypothetical protein
MVVHAFVGDYKCMDIWINPWFLAL